MERPSRRHPKLHVTKIPKNLTDADLQKIFEKYGTVVEAFICKKPKSAKGDLNWGFVVLSSFEDAEKAIAAQPKNIVVKYSTETLHFININGKTDSAPNGGKIFLDESRPSTVYRSYDTTINPSPPTNGLRKLSLGQSMSSSGGEEHCKVCGKDSVEFCMCCQTYYCSLQCANVIRRHKLVCVGDVDDFENKSVSTFSTTSGPIKPQRMSDVPMHSVKQETSTPRRSLDSHFNNKLNDNNKKPRNHPEKNDRKESFLNPETNSDDSEPTPRNTPPRPNPINTQNNKKSPKIREKINSDHSDTEISQIIRRVASKCPLPKDKFTKVTVTWVDENSTYVFLNDRLKEFIDINSEISKTKMSPAAPSDLKENSKCAAKYDGEWFRAKIVRVMPRKALVEFVDFGNSEEIPFGDIMKLPDKYTKTPRIAFPIKFEDGTRVKTEDVISVKPVGMDGPTCYVVAEKNKKPSRREKSDSDSDSEIEPPLSLKTFLQVNIMKVEKNDTYWVITREGFNATLVMSDEIESSLPTKVQRPELNLLYATEIGGQWYRARVTNLSPLTVFLIDSGTSEEVTEVFKLGKQFFETTPKAFKVKIDSVNSNLRVMDSILIRAIRKKNDLTIVETKKETADNNHYHRKEENGKKYVEIASETFVTISSFESTRSVFLQIADDEKQQEFLNSIINECKNAPLLSEEPLCGELVAATYHDYLDYRGEVLSKDGANFKILFVDFGNVETVQLSDLKVLPENFKNVPYCAVKVGLAGLPKSEFNTTATELMNLLATKSKFLQIVYENDLQNVQLFDMGKESTLNEKLEELMKSSWKRKGLNPKIFETHDLIFERLATGEEVIISTAEQSKNGYLGMASSYKRTNNVAEKLKKYQDDNLPLKPQIYEVCLAKNENKWCRAVCLKNDCDESEIFFIDHGNICKIKHQDIRSIHYKFMIDPSTFKFFKFYGQDKIPFDVQDNIEKEFRRKKFEATIVHDDGATATVFVPTLNKILKKLNLPEIISPVFP